MAFFIVTLIAGALYNFVKILEDLSIYKVNMLNEVVAIINFLTCVCYLVLFNLFSCFECHIAYLNNTVIQGFINCYNANHSIRIFPYFVPS